MTLVKGSDISQNVPVLTGQCGKCKTLYSADHETLSGAVSKEAASAYREYWNDSFGVDKSFKLVIATYGKHLFKSLHEL